MNALIILVLVGCLMGLHAASKTPTPTRTPSATLTRSRNFGCGNGIIEVGELCERGKLNGFSCDSFGLTNGTLSCDAKCTFDTSQCLPGTTPQAGCGNGLKEGSEQCDGQDFGFASCRSLGYVGGGRLACQRNCKLITAFCDPRGCGNNIIEGGEDCDGTASISSSTCITLGYGIGNLTCYSNCTFDTKGCSIVQPFGCGNGQIDAGEECDTTNLRLQTCVSRGYQGGILQCVACRFDYGRCVGPQAGICGNSVVDTNEQCDGTNFNFQTCPSLGFSRGILKCTPACQLDSSACLVVPQSCGNGIIESNEQCDGTNLGGQTCNSRGFVGGPLRCTRCAFDVAQCVSVKGTPTTCGDGVVQSGEYCDVHDVGGTNCVTFGFASGQVSCFVNCSLDHSRCSYSTATCGNGILESGEQCDGVVLGGASCITYGYTSGTLACSSVCTVVTSGCSLQSRCGNGVIESPEQCDGGSLGGLTCAALGLGSGSLRCSGTCNYLTDQCSAVAACGLTVCGVCYSCVGLTCQPAAAGTPCDDRNANTANDQCNGLGLCSGNNLCSNVLCTNQPCQVGGTCDSITGRCLSGSNLPNGQSCNDGNPNTLNDQCINGVCQGTVGCASACAAESECTYASVCNTATGSCTVPLAKPNGIACNDGNAQTTRDQCVNGVCQGSLLCAGIVCPVVQCYAQGVCNTATGGCILGAQYPDNTPCDDGNAATSSDTCRSGTCIGQTVCSGVVCPSDQCSIPGICDPTSLRCSAAVNKADNSPCDDGLPSTINDRCLSGRCVGQSSCPAICPATQCQSPSPCNTVTQLCPSPVNLPNGTPCNDGNAATTSDQCLAGICVGVAGTCANCATPNQCQTGGCDTRGICQPLQPKLDGTACNDGDFGTVNDNCQKGLCAGVRVCANVQCPGGPCVTAGVCNSLTGCPTPVPVQSGTACDDGNPLTAQDTCQNGVCVGTYGVCGACPAGGVCYQGGICNPALGRCTDPSPLAAGVPCDDSNSTTVEDKCDGRGNCYGRLLCAQVTCPKGPCLLSGTCDFRTGACSPSVALPDGFPCDDNDPNTSGDTCRAGMCMGLVLNCGNSRLDPGEDCDGSMATSNTTCANFGLSSGEVTCNVACKYNTYSCSGAIRSCTGVPDGSRCNDLNPNTVHDQCINGGCGGIDTCSQIGPCAAGPCVKAGLCNREFGRCSMGEPITDGSPCGTNKAGVCRSGFCLGVASLCSAVQCPATGLGTCWESLCNERTGRCEDQTPVNTGVPCDDGDPNTVGDVCTAGLCIGAMRCGVGCNTPPTSCMTQGKCASNGLLCEYLVQRDFTSCRLSVSRSANISTTEGFCYRGVCVDYHIALLAQLRDQQPAGGVLRIPFPPNMTIIENARSSLAPALSVIPNDTNLVPLYIFLGAGLPAIAALAVGIIVFMKTKNKLVVEDKEDIHSYVVDETIYTDYPTFPALPPPPPPAYIHSVATSPGSVLHTHVVV